MFGFGSTSVRLSRYFLPVLKETPADAKIISHRLMLRAGMIHQSSAGIYDWLPLGLRVLNKINFIVHDEMQQAGAVPVLMPTIQPAKIWHESGRHAVYGEEMLRIKDRHGRDILYGPTNEENVTDIFRKHIKSFKSLPLNLYHIQWKFRDEARPRFGVMRGREFLMKDAYSFDIDYMAALESYNTMFTTYLKIFRRMGLVAIPMQAETGPVGGNFSHEFHILADTGESSLYYDQALDNFSLLSDGSNIDELKRFYSAADEKHDPTSCPIPISQLKCGRGIEVGHIFYFGTKYSEPMGATVTGPDGTTCPVHMGSYGIGISRLVAALIESSHDDNGIVWHESVAPFKVGLIDLRPDNALSHNIAESIFTKLTSAGVETLLDDCDDSPGTKFARMELIGLPWIVTVSPRNTGKGVVELKCRKSGKVTELTVDSLIQRFLHR